MRVLFDYEVKRLKQIIEKAKKVRRLMNSISSYAERTFSPSILSYGGE